MHKLSLGISAAVSWVLFHALVNRIVSFESVRRYLDQRAGDGSADHYTEALHARVAGEGATALWLCLVTGLLLWGSRKSLIRLARSISTEAAELTLEWIRSLKHSCGWW